MKKYAKRFQTSFTEMSKTRKRCTAKTNNYLMKESLDPLSCIFSDCEIFQVDRIKIFKFRCNISRRVFL